MKKTALLQVCQALSALIQVASAVLRTDGESRLFNPNAQTPVSVWSGCSGLSDGTLVLA